MKGLLTERDAETVVMRHQDATPKQIAKRYGVTVGTVQYHLKKLENVTLDQALQRLNDLARIDMVQTVRRWAKALSEADTEKLQARDLRDLQTAIDKAPAAKTPDPPKPPKTPQKKGGTGGRFGASVA